MSKHPISHPSPRRLPVLVSAALLALARAVSADPKVEGGFCLPPRSTDAWIETWAEVENGDAAEFKGTLEVELPGFRAAGASARRDVAVAPGSKKRFFLVLANGAGRTELVFRLRDARGREVLQKKEAGSWVGGPEKTLVVISRPEQPAVLFASLAMAKLTGRYQRWDAEEAHLPEHVEGWTAAGLVVLAGVDLTAWSEEQRRSLRAWVDIGGQVLLLPGSDRKWFESAGVKQLVDVGRVSEASPDASQRAWFGKNGPETVLAFENAGDGPLFHIGGNLTNVWPVGRGRVAAVTFDTTIPSLSRENSEVTGLAGFAEDVLDELAPKPLPWNDYADTHGTWYWRGFIVALGQGVVGYPATAAVLLGLFAYVLVIGPANFWILRRKHAPALTVVTVPAAGLAVTILILVLGWFLRDNRIQVNRVTILRPGAGDRWDAREHVVAVAGKRREALIDSPTGRLTEMTDGRNVVRRNIVYGGPTGDAVQRAFEPNEPAYYYAVGRRDLGSVTARSGSDLAVVNGSRHDIVQAWYYEAGSRVLELGPIPSGGSYRGSLGFIRPRRSPFTDYTDESPEAMLLRALDPQFLRTTEIAVIAILKGTSPVPTVDGKPADMKTDRTVLIIPVERER